MRQCCSPEGYESIDYASNHSSRRAKRVVVLCAVYSFFILVAFFSLLRVKHSLLHQEDDTSNLRNVQRVMHISDPHIDVFFEPDESVPGGGCHSCGLAKYRSFYLSNSSKAKCPTEEEVIDRVRLEALAYKRGYESVDNFSRARNDYRFGRYGCDPPPMLWFSLLDAMKEVDPSPPVVVFTGDMSPHNYPDDDFILTSDTSLNDLCMTKFFATKAIFKELVAIFPKTQWAYAPGNNDHFPKSVYWQPYIDKLGKMLLDIGFFRVKQYEQFVQFGSSFVDVKGVRYISIDMTLFVPNGEAIFSNQTSVVPKLLAWLDDSLQEAENSGLAVYFVGHQPITTRFGVDELDIDSTHFHHLEKILKQHASVIQVGLFGHNNMENVVQVMSTKSDNLEASALFPGIIATGLSPRAPNNPSFGVLYKHAESGLILDFLQISLTLQGHGKHSIESWDKHEEKKYYSWQTLSGESSFSSKSLHRFISRVGNDMSTFFSLQKWRRGGFIGPLSPENFKCDALHLSAKDVALCLFPKQDWLCWDPTYWAK